MMWMKCSLRRAGGGMRFALYVLGLSIAHLMASNAFSSQFIQRYSHPGVALIHSRSDDPQLRRKGLSMLTERLDFRVTPGVVKLVMGALNDSDEGVIARASHASAVPDISDGPVDRTKNCRVPCAFFRTDGLFGSARESEARRAAARLIWKAAQDEPVAAAYMAGLLKVSAIEELKNILSQSEKNENARVAAIWALGELRDSRLLDTIAGGLKDKALLFVVSRHKPWKSWSSPKVHAHLWKRLRLSPTECDLSRTKLARSRGRANTSYWSCIVLAQLSERWRRLIIRL